MANTSSCGNGISSAARVAGLEPPTSYSVKSCPNAAQPVIVQVALDGGSSQFSMEERCWDFSALKCHHRRAEHTLRGWTTWTARGG